MSIATLLEQNETRRAIADFEKIYNQDASARLKTEIKNRWHTRSKK